VFIHNHVSSSIPENQSFGAVFGFPLRTIARRTASSFLADRSTTDGLLFMLLKAE
jgi:hypothetical protein